MHPKRLYYIIKTKLEGGEVIFKSCYFDNEIDMIASVCKNINENVDFSSEDSFEYNIFFMENALVDGLRKNVITTYPYTVQDFKKAVNGIVYKKGE